MKEGPEGKDQHAAPPGKPEAHNYGLLWLYYGLVRGIVACHFGLLGVPGVCIARTANCGFTQHLAAVLRDPQWLSGVSAFTDGPLKRPNSLHPEPLKQDLKS